MVDISVGSVFKPDLSKMASISSMTSKYASLLVYFTPARLQGILDNWPVGSVSPTLLPPKEKGNTRFGWCSYTFYDHVNISHLFTGESIDDRSEDCGRPDHLLEDVGLGSQRKAIVEHLFEDFVHSHQVVFDHAFGAISKVVLLYIKPFEYLVDILDILLKVRVLVCSLSSLARLFRGCVEWLCLTSNIFGTEWNLKPTVLLMCQHCLPSEDKEHTQHEP